MGNDDDSIKVDGPPDEVEKAKTELESQAGVLIKTMAFADVKVDAKYHKHIIGKGGSTINKIKSETDVTINIPDTDSGVTIIRIEGNKAGVEKASKELNGMVDKMENEKEKDLIIENRFHRQLIGPKGENIEKIRKDFVNVQISFPDLGVKSDIVKLRGPKKDVDDCSKYFNKLTREMAESSYQVKVPIFKQFQSEMANITTKEIKIPSKIHNTVIGAGGKLIQSIMSECGGVAIKFPENGSGSDLVTVRGPVDDVEK